MWRLHLSAAPGVNRLRPDSAINQLGDPDLAVNLADLIESTMGKIVLASTVAYVLAQLALSATWPLFFGWRILLVVLLVLTTAAITYWLIPRAFLAAQISWYGGISAAIVLAAISYQAPTVLLLLALPPLTILVTLGWQAGAVAWLLAWLIPFLLGQQGVIAGVDWPLIIGVSLGAALVAILGWATTSSLMTVLVWFVEADRASHKNLTDARSHRAELVATVKQLDQLNYRLARTNADLAAAWRTADEALSFKSEFVTNVSHELRTPLNLIIGFSEVMTLAPESYGGQKLPGPYRADMNAIYSSAKHLMALVDDVLDLGRIDANQLVFSREIVAIETLINEAEEILRDQIERKGLAFQQLVADDLPPLNVDRLRIRQVILNLLVNALRFTTEGTIRIEAAPVQSAVRISVTDTGQGIAPENLPNIFEPFQTIDQQRDGVWPEGKGLGLPISKKYVEMHGGAMGATSEVGCGTTVWFTLPAATAQPDSRLQPNRPGLRPAARIEPERLPAERLLILAFDDPATELLLARRLDGFRLLSTADFSAAADLATELQPLAILVDDTTKVTVEVDSQSRNAPIIPLPWLTCRQLAARTGIRQFLLRPISRPELLAAVDALPAEPMRILIADEDPEAVRLVRRILRGRLPNGIFLEAYSGGEVLQRTENEAPDLIILAAEMLDESGRPAWRTLSSLINTGEAPEAFGAGASIIVTAGDHWADSAPYQPHRLQIDWADGLPLAQFISHLRALLADLAT